MTKASIGAGLLVLGAFRVFGQEAGPLPEFEVASVKVAEPLNLSGGMIQIRIGCTGGPESGDPEIGRAHV